MDSQALDVAIEQHIQSVSALGGMTDPKVMMAFITDMAQDIHTKQEICDRFGISMTDMLAIIKREGVARQIRERRAIFQSGDSVQDRARAYYGVVALDAAPKLDAIIHNPTSSAGNVLDALTLASRAAGIHTAPAATVAAGATIGARFVVNINFTGQEPKNITLEGAAGPPMPLDGVEDDA